MSDQLAREVQALAVRGSTTTMQKIAARLKMAVYRRRVRAYRDCFCDEAGEVTESGRRVLADLARIAGVGVARLSRSATDLHETEGSRRIVLHMLESLYLDLKRLERLRRNLREDSDDE